MIIVDSGVANLTSVMAAFERLGVPATISADPAAIRAADRVVLPGVGSAPAAMRQLQAKGLIEVLRGLTQPVLGICLGMQLLFEASEESGSMGETTPCLGVVPGTVRRLKGGPHEPIPHMGWNDIETVRPEARLLKGVSSGAYMYFVHSFAAPESDSTLARCVYGQSFTALCGHKNFFGCQSHPERSGEVGQKILRNFMEL